MLTVAEKDLIVSMARQAADKHEYNTNGGRCLPLAVELMKELARCNVRAVLQAGSAQWRCVKDDDGISNTHFAYVWEMSDITRMRMADGMMPEMHCWIGIPSTQEIVDISTYMLPEQAKLRAGINWTAELPPDYIWSGRDGFPEGARYLVDKDATMVALWLAKVGLGLKI